MAIVWTLVRLSDTHLGSYQKFEENKKEVCIITNEKLYTKLEVSTLSHWEYGCHVRKVIKAWRVTPSVFSKEIRGFLNMYKIV